MSGTSNQVAFCLKRIQITCHFSVTKSINVISLGHCNPHRASLTPLSNGNHAAEGKVTTKLQSCDMVKWSNAGSSKQRPHLVRRMNLNFIYSRTCIPQPSTRVLRHFLVCRSQRLCHPNIKNPMETTPWRTRSKPIPE